MFSPYRNKLRSLAVAMMLKVHRLFNFRIPRDGYEEVTFVSKIFRYRDVLESLDQLGYCEILKKR